VNDALERACGMAAGVGRQALRLPRQAARAGELRRLVAAGRWGVTVARFVTRAGAEVAATRRTGRKAVAGAVGLGRGGVFAAAGGARKLRAECENGAVELATELSAEQKVQAAGRRVAAAVRLGGIRARRESVNQTEPRVSGGGSARESVSCAAAMLGAGARNVARSAALSGPNETIAAARRVWLPSVAAIARRSVAPVGQNGSVSRQRATAPVAVAEETARAAVDNSRARDLPRKLSDRLARQASLPPAAASGFDTRLGPDWHGVGSLW